MTPPASRSSGVRLTTGQPSRRLHHVSSALVGMVALTLPLGFFSVGYSALGSNLETKAAVKAEIVSQLVNASPNLWQFEEHRLTELLVRMPPEQEGEQARIIGADRQVVATSPNQVPWPMMARSAMLYDTGDVVGHVEIQHSIRALLTGTAIAGVVAGLVAWVLLTFLRRLHRHEQAMRATMQEEQERARVTLHSIGDAVITTDAHQCIDYLNPVAERLTQWSLDEARGRQINEVCSLIDEHTMQAMDPPIGQALRNDAICSANTEAVALVRRDGTTIGIEESASPIHGPQGDVIGAALVFRDVTATRRMAQRISWAATHDALTGICNRREFETRVETALLGVRQSGRSPVVCFMDLDQFKVVNDTCGHAAGDGLLRQISALLQLQLRPTDTLARLGGDEFGVLLDDCTIEAAQAVATDLLNTVREFRHVWEGKVFTLSVSIGLVAVTAETSNRTEVFSAADTACYSAKEQGRNRICVYQSSDADMAQRRREMGWASRLTQALEEERLRLYFQPYLALAIPGSQGQHIEILLRLIDEDGQLVPPGSFLPAAERYNLMPAIDRWVIRNVFMRYRDLVASMGGPLTCAINLSGTTLNSEGLLDYIAEQALVHDLPQGVVCFEITETAAINNLQHATQFMKDVKALGFHFALDDFGMGTSSFAYLKTLPVDYLKIDGSFVRNIAHDPIDRAMTETINRIGHLMGLQTVGEFAESSEVIAELRSMGVDFAQGYGVQRPRPLPEPGPKPQPVPVAEPVTSTAA
jgi:diguanylate cyclase (GGDEF)-like protein/PAS domain S-box-containing protein